MRPEWKPLSPKPTYQNTDIKYALGSIKCESSAYSDAFVAESGAFPLCADGVQKSMNPVTNKTTVNVSISAHCANN